MKKATKKAKVSDDYNVSIKVLGKTYEAKGTSVKEALEKLTIRNLKGVRGIVTVEHGDVKKDRILMPLQATRLFNSHGLMREVAIKNVSTLFQGI